MPLLRQCHLTLATFNRSDQRRNGRDPRDAVQLLQRWPNFVHLPRLDTHYDIKGESYRLKEKRKAGLLQNAVASDSKEELQTTA